MMPELLSPAGSPESLRAAVQNGAGAVYLGWGDFNARRSAKNFSDEEFREALRYCHARGARVFLTLNTLLTDRELPLALETAWHVLETLEEARPWLRRDAQTTRAIPGSRRMELLYRAQDQSRLLRKILAALPEGTADPCPRLENLYDYICGATSEFKQLDRLETIQIQLRTLRNQLKLLLGE